MADKQKSPVELAREAHDQRERELAQRAAEAEQQQVSLLGRMIVASRLPEWFPGTEWELVTRDPFLVIQPEGGGFMLHLRQLGREQPEVRWVLARAVDDQVTYETAGIVAGPADVGSYLSDPPENFHPDPAQLREASRP